jgi:hypothetical protein
VCFSPTLSILKATSIPNFTLYLFQTVQHFPSSHLYNYEIIWRLILFLYTFLYLSLLLHSVLYLRVLRVPNFSECHGPQPHAKNHKSFARFARSWIPFSNENQVCRLQSGAKVRVITSPLWERTLKFFEVPIAHFDERDPKLGSTHHSMKKTPELREFHCMEVERMENFDWM